MAELALVMFVGMGPFKVLVYYLAAIHDAEAAVARRVAVRAVATATITALGLVLTGALLAWLLHFSNDALVGMALKAAETKNYAESETEFAKWDRSPRLSTTQRQQLQAAGVAHVAVWDPAGADGWVFFSSFPSPTFPVRHAARRRRAGVA